MAADSLRLPTLMRVAKAPRDTIPECTCLWWLSRTVFDHSPLTFSCAQGGCMRSMFGVVIIVLVAALGTGVSVGADGPPVWAYGVPANAAPAGNPPAAPGGQAV